MRLRHYLTLTAPYVHRYPKTLIQLSTRRIMVDFDGEVPAIISRADQEPI